MKKVKIGVFGLRRGLDMVDRVLVNNDVADLVAVCDRDDRILERCRKRVEKNGVFDTVYYSDFDKFIEHDMDGVIVVNHANEHVPYAIRLLDRGINVMTECLACANMKEAVELVEAVERSGKIYTYAENYCFTSVRWEMRERYRKGDIGELMYAQGEYIHDCSSIWPDITYGERDHWRNQMSSTFYCTHSIGPILYMTGLRPVQVCGFETPNKPFYRELGCAAGCAGMEMITLENGAILRSVHFNLKHTSAQLSPYQLNGDRGAMNDMGDELYLYREDEKYKPVEQISYKPAPIVDGSEKSGHGGGDFYPTYYFIRAIMGDEEALRRSINVYDALDMSIPGILAYRSIINGNVPVKIPNLRNKEEREAYRNDTFCTFKEIGGDMYVPNNIEHPGDEIPDEVYEEVRRQYLSRDYMK
ncbi:MAG: Gfo/Idh/MocA family oxidoreductase [Clostridia bacterium]|nr:Gfo/Idh/MocA family oxidoreductase [Clostridia bacterium]